MVVIWLICGDELLLPTNKEKSTHRLIESKNLITFA